MLLTTKKVKIWSEDILPKLKLEVDKNSGDDLANITHYLQNSKNGVSRYFKPAATKYLTEIYEELKIVEEPDFQYYLPITWDIPFHPPEKQKFTFIDLFAGIGGINVVVTDAEGGYDLELWKGRQR